LVAVLFLLAASQAFRNMSVRSKESKFKNGMIYIALAAMPMTLFLGLMVLDIFVETPTIVFGPTGQLVLLGLAVVTLLIVSV
ncbi:HAAS domain-containing protein, partial [Veillonella sp. ZSJB6]